MSYSYSELKQAIQDFTENDETGFVTNLPVFIRSAEDRIFSSVDLENFRKNARSKVDLRLSRVPISRHCGWDVLDHRLQSHAAIRLQHELSHGGRLLPSDVGLRRLHRTGLNRPQVQL